MTEETGCDRVRAPLGDAERLTIGLAMKQSVRDEVLDVVVERIARDIGLCAPSHSQPTLRLRRAKTDDDPPGAAWPEPTGATPLVRVVTRHDADRWNGGVLARIG